MLILSNSDFTTHLQAMQLRILPHIVGVSNVSAEFLYPYLLMNIFLVILFLNVIFQIKYPHT